MRLKNRLLTISALVILIGTSHSPAGATLRSVGSVDGGNGFPIWYQDDQRLKLEHCLDNNAYCLASSAIVGNTFSQTIGFGATSYWWSGSAAVAFPEGDGLLALALEAGFVNGPPVDGEQIAVGRVQIQINVTTPGRYVITHPYGTLTQDVTAAAIGAGYEIDVTSEIGNATAPGPTGDFTMALVSGVGPFLFWNGGLPLRDPGTSNAFYIGNPTIPHTVLGSPTGANIFRIERDGVLVAETDLFAIQGKVFTGAGNTAPEATADTAGAPLNTPTLIDVLANDLTVNVPINPASIAITGGPNGTAATKTVNGKVMVEFTPAPGFLGETSFTYTVASLTGLVSAPATVTVMVEDLRVSRIVMRPRLMKWRIEGTSSDTTANTITARLSTGQQSATLSGGQEVPPVTTTATGTAIVTINDALTDIGFTLNVQNLQNIQAAHIHVGAMGAEGPPIFNLSLVDFASPLTGTLTAADLQVQDADGIHTFSDAIAAILSGNAYINVHTTGNTAGEIRGQLGPSRIIGTGSVRTDGTWSINGLTPVRPDESGTISVESSNRVQLLRLPVIPR